MEAITVKELLAAVHGELLQGDETAQILGVNTDSRTVKAGEVFVPLVGERFDGHDYIEKAISAGCCPESFTSRCLTRCLRSRTWPRGTVRSFLSPLCR